MIADAKLSFTSNVGATSGYVECTNSKTLDALNFKSMAEPGKGSQLFVNVFSDGGFTSGAEVASIYIKTGTTAPGATQVLAIGPFSAATASVAGQIAKVPLPSKNLLQYVSAYFYAQTAVTAGGKLSVFLSLD